MAVNAKSAREDFEKKKFYGSEKVLRGKKQTPMVWPSNGLFFSFSPKSVNVDQTTHIEPE